MSVPAADQPERGVRPEATVMSTVVRTVVAMMCAVAAACASGAPASPTPATTTLRLVLLSPTTRRPDLGPDQIGCANNSGATHVHPSWQGFQDANMQPVGSDRYEITFDRVPVGERLWLTITDQNWCIAGASIGVAASGVSVNGTSLAQNWWIDAIQPGFEFTIDASGKVTQ